MLSEYAIFLNHVLAYYDSPLPIGSDETMKRLQIGLNNPHGGHKEGQQFHISGEKPIKASPPIYIKTTENLITKNGCYNTGKLQFIYTYIWETLNLSTDADTSTDTKTIFFFFFLCGCNDVLQVLRKRVTHLMNLLMTKVFVEQPGLHL